MHEMQVRPAYNLVCGIVLCVNRSGARLCSLTQNRTKMHTTINWRRIAYGQMRSIHSAGTHTCNALLVVLDDLKELCCAWIVKRHATSRFYPKPTQQCSCAFCSDGEKGSPCVYHSFVTTNQHKNARRIAIVIVACKMCPYIFSCCS